jgi:predicted CXXCH cytochrome family protein
MRRVICTFVVTALWGIGALAQQTSVVNSPHNLSASGPGRIRATAEQQICIFCHTPHRASAIQPLWNRNMPVNAYRVYSSNTLSAVPGQPTGSSKLCLSCHDGTIALGSVLSRGQTIGMAGGITTLPPGKSNLGTDLSDDHPISFRYDSSLVSKDPKLVEPAAIPKTLRLDGQANLQCSTCHDAHDNSRGNFLVLDNSNSQLCIACHKNTNTTVTGHQQCTACHQAHSAPSGPYLLTGKTVTDTCNTCHGGQNIQAANVAADLAKISIHDTHSPVNNPKPIPNETTCATCHEPHTMTKVAAAAPDLPGNMGKLAGVSAAGAPIPAARFEYEVCFQCHGDKQPTGLAPFVNRQIVQANTRLEFANSAISFHPVEVAGRSTDVPSLRTTYTTASIIACSDCHNSDSGKVAGGSGPDGVHGSNNRPLLALRYETKDGTSESAAAYALCYKCHDRNSILADQSFPKHKLHIVDKQTPCADCHDAHGISSAQGTTTKNARLINFATDVVRPDATTGRLEFNQTMARQGTCYTQCHGVNHSGTTYAGDNAAAAPALRRAVHGRHK